MSLPVSSTWEFLAVSPLAHSLRAIISLSDLLMRAVRSPLKRMAVHTNIMHFANALRAAS